MLGLPKEVMDRALRLNGWRHLIGAAQRLADFRANEALFAQPKSQSTFQSEADLLAFLSPPPTTAELLEACNQEITPFTAQSISRLKINRVDRSGYVYVLFDGGSRLCKIGCTSRGDGSRQRAQMGAHGSPLLNAINAKVNDRFEAESQCHQRFSPLRTNGEWFKADLTEVVTYIHEEIKWTEIDIECTGRVAQYIAASRSADVDRMRLAVTRKASKG